jgi:Uma2 family endonuclease
MVTQTQPKTYTPEDYLAQEVQAQERHEYINGEIRLMTGGTPNHNDIAGNFYIALKLALRQQPYRVFYADQRLWLEQPKIYTYPDIMVVPQPLQLQTGRTDTLIDACLMAEVLSKSTQDYDRGEKFVAYRTLPSFTEYLLIDQYRIYVEHYVKTAAHQWLLSEYDDPDVTLSLQCLGLEIKISELYEGITWSND